MKKYSIYKQTGVDWLGEIPDEWIINKLKYISLVRGSNVDKNIFNHERQVKLCNYVDVYKNEKIDCKSILVQGSCSTEEYNKFQLKKGDVIITKDSETPDDIGIPCLVTEDLDNTVCGYHLSLITSDIKKIIGEYLFRQFQTERLQQYFEIQANGITRYGLGKSIIENTDIIQPSLQEQAQIVNFLNQKSFIIDGLIQKKLRKIELLKEQRTSIINEAVTKGLNPKVKMKDSGVRSIGWIPSHWDLTRLKYLVAFNSGYAFKSEDYSTEGVNLIRIGNLYENILDLERSPIYLPVSFIKDYQSFVVKKNDILISLTGTLGKRDYGYSIVYDKEFPSMLNQRVGRLKIVCEDVLFQFLTYLLLCDVFLNQLFIKPTGTKQGNLSGDDILTNYLPLPTISEQKEIVEYLDKKTSEIDKQVDLENRKIDLLKEYRQSLISEVVTGKIDVRTN